jgi:hydrogenase expression/formation protein HypC
MCLGIPGQIVSISDPTRKLGIVEIAGVRREVNLMCVLQDGATPDSCIGSWVLVHVGFAMALIDSEEAERTMALLEELGDAQDEIRALQQSVAPPVDSPETEEQGSV